MPQEEGETTLYTRHGAGPQSRRLPQAVVASVCATCHGAGTSRSCTTAAQK